MKRLTEFPDQKAYIESLSAEGLAEWIERALKGTPRPLWLGPKEPDERIIDIFRATSDDQKKKIKSALMVLITSKDDSFKIPDDRKKLLDNPYEKIMLDDLLYLVGFLEVGEAYGTIVSWINSRYLVKKTPHEYQEPQSEDLHLNAYRAIVHLVPPEDDRLFQASLEDIKEKTYFGICYRILWGRDLHYMLYYFSRLVRLCMEGYYYFNNEFFYINENHGKFFSDRFVEFSKNLYYDQRIFLMASLLNLKYKIHEGLVKRITSGLCKIYEEIDEIIDFDGWRKRLINLTTISPNDIDIIENKARRFIGNKGGDSSLVFPMFTHKLLLSMCGRSHQDPLSSYEWAYHKMLLDEYRDLCARVNKGNIITIKAETYSYPFMPLFCQFQE